MTGQNFEQEVTVGYIYMTPIKGDYTNSYDAEKAQELLKELKEDND